MSRFSELAKNIINGAENLFSTFVKDLDGASQKVATLSNNNAVVIQGTAVVVSDIKQGASDLIGMGQRLADYGLDTGLPKIEDLADAIFLKATGGFGAPAIPMVNGGIEQIAGILKSVIDSAAVRAQAALKPVPVLISPPMQWSAAVPQQAPQPQAAPGG
jgi:hypothetical protein